MIFSECVTENSSMRKRWNGLCVLRPGHGRAAGCCGVGAGAPGPTPESAVLSSFPVPEPDPWALPDSVRFRLCLWEKARDSGLDEEIKTGIWFCWGLWPGSEIREETSLVVTVLLGQEAPDELAWELVCLRASSLVARGEKENDPRTGPQSVQASDNWVPFPHSWGAPRARGCRNQRGWQWLRGGRWGREMRPSLNPPP